MTLQFTTLEQRANAAVMARLANAEATLDGQPITGILKSGLENATFDGFGAVGTSPDFTTFAANVPAKPEGLQLQITSGVGVGSYWVGSAHPDGTGLVTLNLTK